MRTVIKPERNLKEPPIPTSSPALSADSHFKGEDAAAFSVVELADVKDTGLTLLTSHSVLGEVACLGTNETH